MNDQWQSRKGGAKIFMRLPEPHLEIRISKIGSNITNKNKSVKNLKKHSFSHESHSFMNIHNLPEAWYYARTGTVLLR